MSFADEIERELADIYPDADVDWLAADYRTHCQANPDAEPPTVRAWIDAQPVEYLDAHGAPAAKMTVEQAIQLLTDAAGNCGTFDPLHDPDQIDVAFRMAARRNHPDAGGDADTFRQITEARDLLHREVAA